MTPPPQIPQPPIIPPPISHPRQPPPLAIRRDKIPTAVYLLLLIPIFIINVVWAYHTAKVRVPGDQPYAAGYVTGYVSGNVLVPIAVAAGIACIWKSNRGFRGVTRVLFWASLAVLFSRLGLLANPPTPRPHTSLHSAPVHTTASRQVVVNQNSLCNV